MSYLVVTLNLSNADMYSDIFVTELSDIHYEGFEELPDGLKAYIEAALYDEVALHEVLDQYNPEAMASVRDVSPLPDINWNAAWESSFQPIWVGGEGHIFIRAPFHAPQPARYELVIEPQMAFGTGHHETTSMMLEQMLKINFEGKRVLDFGSGTGILAIMADKLGADSIVAIDNDNWAYRSCIENAALNHAPRVESVLGDSSALLPAGRFAVILANINRNIILSSLPLLEQILLPKGNILLSGILTTDISDILAAVTQYNWHLCDSLENGQWAMLCFDKKT